MTIDDYLEDIQEMLMHGLVLAVILVFWAIVSHLVGFGLQAANLSGSVSNGIAGSIGQAGLANAVLYILVVAARTYRE